MIAYKFLGPGATGPFTDFAWPEQRTVGEFDGKIKYGRLRKPGQTAGDVVFDEKLREDAIRAQGWEVVRWTWADLRDFGPIAAHIRDKFRCSARPHTGNDAHTQVTTLVRAPFPSCERPGNP